MLPVKPDRSLWLRINVGEANQVIAICPLQWMSGNGAAFFTLLKHHFESGRWLRGPRGRLGPRSRPRSSTQRMSPFSPYIRLHSSMFLNTRFHRLVGPPCRTVVLRSGTCGSCAMTHIWDWTARCGCIVMSKTDRCKNILLPYPFDQQRNRTHQNTSARVCARVTQAANSINDWTESSIQRVDNWVVKNIHQSVKLLIVI